MLPSTTSNNSEDRLHADLKMLGKLANIRIGPTSVESSYLKHITLSKLCCRSGFTLNIARSASSLDDRSGCRLPVSASTNCRNRRLRNTKLIRKLDSVLPSSVTLSNSDNLVNGEDHPIVVLSEDVSSSTLRNAVPLIVAVGSRKQMNRVAAARIVAGVTNQGVRHRSVCNSKRDALRSCSRASVPKKSVTLWITGSDPRPALVFRTAFYSTPEASYDLVVHRVLR